MHLTMTVRVEQLQVLYQVAAPVHTPLPMMDLPSRFERQRLIADRAESLLPQPKVTHPSAARQRFLHLVAQALLEVRLPRRVISVGVAPNLDAPADPDGPRRDELNDVSLPLPAQDHAREHPRAVAHPAKVLGLHPGAPLAVVPPTRPPPHRAEDREVHIAIGRIA